ncbi:MAG: MlaD family protein [Myxococcales bacterium]
MTTTESGGLTGRDAVVKAQRRFELVWVIPIVAAAIGVYLAFDEINSRGPTVTITFETAEGLTAGKTKVRFRSVDTGTVESITISEDLSHVVVTCSMLKTSHKHLTENARFWVVRPRVGSGGISGLGTIVSGAYIGMDLGSNEKGQGRENKEGEKKKFERKGALYFAGLARPPIESEDSSGLRVVLRAEGLSGIDVGSPLLHRQTEVGSVVGHQLTKTGESVEIEVYVQPEFSMLVGSNSRFWNASGVAVKAGMGGIDIQTESLTALISGGIAFDTPGKSVPKTLEHGVEFWLHDSRPSLEESYFRYGGLALIVEAPELGSVKVGDRVYYREEPVGAVVSHGLSADHSRVRMHLNIQNRYASLVRNNSEFWNASGISANLGLKGLRVHTESLEALLSGGIAFATPDSAGAQVKAGSVFQLHAEAKEKWTKWAGAEGGKKKTDEGLLSRIFHHHEDKTEEAAAADHDPEQPHPAEHPKHGFMHRLFHHGH